LNYRFPLRINWTGQSEEQTAAAINASIKDHSAKLIVNASACGLPARLWTELVTLAGVRHETRWSGLDRPRQISLLKTLTSTEFPVTGKSLNKDEFVTCGGVRLSEVNFKTMESKLCPGLYFAGELLDIDGITGGFNFQAAWTTGWIAGHAMASAISS
jgi:predicted Rossmann fold flavoprotein